MSFDLHYGFETECDDTITEHERPKAPEPMILESLSNYDLSELLGKEEEEMECIPVAPTETSDNKPQTISVCTASSNTISKKNSSNMDYLVLEDVDESDYIDGQTFTSAGSNMRIVQAMNQEPLHDNFTGSYGGSAKAATTVSEKSIKSTKASSKTQSSRLRRLASNITRAMSNKFRKLCRPARVEGSSTVDGKNGENGVSSSTSTQHLL